MSAAAPVSSGGWIAVLAAAADMLFPLSGLAGGRHPGPRALPCIFPAGAPTRGRAREIVCTIAYDRPNSPAILINFCAERVQSAGFTGFSTCRRWHVPCDRTCLRYRGLTE